MDTIKASTFKAKCLQLMDEVAATGEPVIITKNGKPIAQLAPIPGKADSLLGGHAGMIEILDDIVAPLDEEWEAAS